MAHLRLNPRAPTTGGQVDDVTSTPGLSPTISADPSPAFATILQTPDGSEAGDFDFSIGEPAQSGELLKETVPSGLPECWGHRGVSY